MSLSLRLWMGFIGSLILSILPMPEWLFAFRPPWVLLLVLYIEYFLPSYFKLSTVLLIGILLDVLLSTIIGEHSFALLLVTWIASNYSRRFQFFSMVQQILFIGFFCFFYQAILAFVDALSGFHYDAWIPLASALISVLLWPWIRFLGNR